MVNLIDNFKQISQKAKESLPYFIEHIYPLSYSSRVFVPAPHTFKWGKRLQENKRTATLSARKHLKSTVIYAFIMWLIFRMEEGVQERWLYMSYNQKMSMYHTENIKNLIDNNPFFSLAKITDSSLGKNIIDYTYGDGSRFQCTPSGILTFNRGWHGKGVICDDILQDPTSEMNFTVIEKINRTFREQVMSLPIEGGEVHLVGTAQHAQDLFFQLKDNKSWDWAQHKAIINEKEKTVLWPELFSYKRLCQIRSEELGEKAFKKEYMCSPVWSEMAYFQRDELIKIIDPELKSNYIEQGRHAGQWKNGKIVAGLDIGKKAHPSHLVIFHCVRGHYTQLYEQFMTNWDYTRQVKVINGLIDFFLIDELRYDDTRSELESFREQNEIDKRIWKPVVFGTKNKFMMASNLSKHVNNKTITLLNNQRQMDSILSVNNDLQAPSTDIGHGDAFWSVCLALYEPPTVQGYVSV